MRDHFALLDEPRRPWLDADSLKQKFLVRSAAVHPDRVHQSPTTKRLAAHERYTALNAAYQCLREPRERLHHLLELELGEKPSDLTSMPDELMDLFFAVGRTLRDADTFLVEKQNVTSPLIQVQLFSRGQVLTERLDDLRRPIATRRAELLSAIKELDAKWNEPPRKPLAQLQAIWRLLGFYERWLAQLQERSVKISF